jgi:hypothetical protein
MKIVDVSFKLAMLVVAISEKMNPRSMLKKKDPSCPSIVFINIYHLLAAGGHVQKFCPCGCRGLPTWQP